MAMGAVLLFMWWLIAAATGPEAYATFMAAATSWFGLFIAVGFTWTFYQHMFSGIRHLIMDSGEGFDLATSRGMAFGAFVASIALTIVTWVIILSTKGV